MYITPVTLQQANHFALKNCKQYQPVDEQVFSIGCAVREKLIGIVIINRPVSLKYDDGLTLEVSRIYSTAGRPAYCMLYGAAARAAGAMGFHRIITTQPKGTPDSSLRAAGWKYVGPIRAKAGFMEAETLLCYERRLAT